MKYFKLALLFFILPTILFGGRFFALAANTNDDEIQVLNKEIADRKDKIKQLEDTMNAYKRNISEQQTQAQSLKNQLHILDNHIAELTTDLNITRAKIDETQLEIEALNLSIADKQKSIDRQKVIIAKMVQNINESDRKNYVEILLSYNNFAEFFNDVKYTENVYIDLGRSVKALRSAKEDLDGKKKQAEAKQQTYLDLQKELENKQQNLNGQVSAKQNLLDQTKSSEARYRTLLSSLKQQYQVIESEQLTFEDRLRRKLEQQNKIPAAGDVAMSWPAPSHYINATFHDPSYPFKNVFQHSGIDIKASQGTPVHAAASGYIAQAKKCSSASCYSYVLIVHNGVISSLYGHLSQINVNIDQFVNRGDVIGYSGGTPGMVGSGPFVTGPHLHFEVRQSGIPINPMPYLMQ